MVTRSKSGIGEGIARPLAENGCAMMMNGFGEPNAIERQTQEATRRLLAEKQPSGSFATVEQIAALALFLCSAAANNMTGTAIPVDGAGLLSSASSQAVKASWGKSYCTAC